MDQEFTAEEIKDAARTARIYCPGFSEEKFESLMEIERRVDESGYLEAIQGLLRLEEEKGIPCTEALDACEKLMEQKTRLEQQVTTLEKRVTALKKGEESLMAQIRQANGDYDQVKKATAKAEQELAQIRGKYAATEKKLEAFNKRTEKRKQRIGKEVENCRKQANVTKEEVIIAGKIKADADNRGLNLELVLNISQELAAHKDASKQFIIGIQKHNSLTKYLKELDEWVEKRRAEVTSNMSNLRSQQGQIQAQVNALEETRRGIENIITQLQADVAAEEELRRFYWRYQGSAGLLECLASREQLIFMRCNNALSAATRFFDESKVAHFWTDKPVTNCPHCGSSNVDFDEKPYLALGLPVGAEFKLQLG